MRHKSKAILIFKPWIKAWAVSGSRTFIAFFVSSDGCSLDVLGADNLMQSIPILIRKIIIQNIIIYHHGERLLLYPLIMKQLLSECLPDQEIGPAPGYNLQCKPLITWVKLVIHFDTEKFEGRLIIHYKLSLLQIYCEEPTNLHIVWQEVTHMTHMHMVTAASTAEHDSKTERQKNYNED